VLTIQLDDFVSCQFLNKMPDIALTTPMRKYSGSLGLHKLILVLH